MHNIPFIGLLVDGKKNKIKVKHGNTWVKKEVTNYSVILYPGEQYAGFFRSPGGSGQ